MSIDDEKAAIGALALRRGQLRRRHALLENEASRMIRQIAEAMAGFTGMGGTLRFDGDRALLDKAIQGGGLDRVKALLDEYDQVRLELVEVDRLATCAGI